MRRRKRIGAEQLENRRMLAADMNFLEGDLACPIADTAAPIDDVVELATDESSDNHDEYETELVALLTGPGGVAGEATVEIESEDGETEFELEVEIENAIPNATFDVSVSGVVVGQIETDESGEGELEIEIEGEIPAELAGITTDSSVTVGEDITGIFSEEGQEEESESDEDDDEVEHDDEDGDDEDEDDEDGDDEDEDDEDEDDEDEDESDYEDGDINEDGTTDEGDINTMFQALRAVADNSLFDLDSSGNVDQSDAQFLTEVILGTNVGDANLDGVFDSSDLVTVFQAGQYEDGVSMNSTWSTGDWNGDGEFDTNDLVTAFQEGGYITAANADAVFGS